MKFKFWGVRGSIPTPGANTVKYGGNTTCIEIRTDANDLIILDAGTGIHALAQNLLKEMPVQAHIFITHTHWDHIQGLPFFIPIFIPNNHITLYGGVDPVTNETIKRALSVQLQYSFFPIREAQLNARIDYNSIKPGQPIKVGSATITPIILSHPVLNFGYRIDSDGQSIFFTGDYEPQLNIYAPDDDEYEEFQAFVDAKWDEIVRAMNDVDALIVDASYTTEEYAAKQGWGHGTYDSAIRLAQAAQAKKLYFTHHEPTRTDASLEAIYRSIVQNNPDTGCELLLAQEGIDIVL
ncbi:MAG: MBL fold metallo-hydrolase [Methylobacter sp.]|nr:MBL fold metallo-hydrolase [Methylobacter sp.]MDP2097523.1 MBL fold metallo-hydrolase [Methylobacter sp.]MDP2429364.1 MBL fold metallo-hydrolase [Methylobacter sp.]MDP3053789.1 MBL fold metallo-hydrolase [Methylobacter sp.]MDP3362772.1 MBL fold metallo-hydrolase [Methylobacter sp.]